MTVSASDSRTEQRGMQHTLCNKKKKKMNRKRNERTIGTRTTTTKRNEDVKQSTPSSTR